MLANICMPGGDAVIITLYVTELFWFHFLNHSNNGEDTFVSMRLQVGFCRTVPNIHMHFQAYFFSLFTYSITLPVDINGKVKKTRCILLYAQYRLKENSL